MNIYPGLDFFYMIFWYFFLLLLWSIIWHQLFLLLATFVFGPMEKTATCVTPGIRDFGHWFWKIGRDAHNLQPFNGLISKKTKAVAISHLGTTTWLAKGNSLQFFTRNQKIINDVINFVSQRNFKQVRIPYKKITYLFFCRDLNIKYRFA